MVAVEEVDEYPEPPLWGLPDVRSFQYPLWDDWDD